ncbi:hypothetical protein ACH5RR_032565 [Cinchona calisaya]|uniref:Reverse transcriptase domain-containing protein n=1 Tax=Cinchona calisaya TaxID=153742 RepID=A0ABD2YNP8_9GENT
MGTLFTRCWDIVAHGLMSAVQDFFVGIPLSRAISSALLVLIPKIDNPSSFKDFPPIPFCNFLKKILTKILENWLTLVLPSIFSLEQIGFLNGRTVVDSILLAQEMFMSLSKMIWGHNITVKLGMMKDFERVS